MTTAAGEINVFLVDDHPIVRKGVRSTGGTGVHRGGRRSFGRVGPYAGQNAPA